MTSQPSKSRLSDADIERLEKLASMRERGILTQQEFDDQKAIIQGAPATPTVAPEAESSAAPLTSTSPTEEATWDRWGKMPITPDPHTFNKRGKDRASTNVETSIQPEPKRKGLVYSSIFFGNDGELRVFTIFSMSFLLNMSLFYRPNWLITSIGLENISYYLAEVIGYSIIPFIFGYLFMIIYKLCVPLSSQPKANRLRWLGVQSLFIILVLIGKLKTG